ncbi:hypothetical protein FRB97_007456 [Tulasnella sp. 331]|nr:hypothetical protein FRB97_007456 [Tulasnella sp. 331]
MLGYYNDAVRQLEQIGAKTWDEIFPREHFKCEPDRETWDQSSSKQPATVSIANAPTKRYMLLESCDVSAAGAHLTPSYDELFEAIWAGDTQKVEEMCLPPTEGCQPTRKDLLQVTVGVVPHGLSNTRAYNSATKVCAALFVALRARKWATAHAILEIAKRSSLWELKQLSHHAHNSCIAESDEEDSDAESDDTAVTPTKPGFDNIATKFSTISVDVNPSELFSLRFCVPLDGAQSDYAQVITVAIHNGDVEMFKEICDLMLCLESPQLPNQDSSILNAILEKDTPSILHEYIRRTGDGLALPKELGVEALQMEDEEDSKLYQGLIVHGQKRKDLARKGDPDAPAMKVDRDVVPLLWRAATTHSESIIAYLAGPQPLEAYKHYLYTATKPAKRLAAISGLDAQLPTLLGFNINHLGESVVLMRISLDHTSSRPLETLKKLMAYSPNMVVTAINTQVKLQRVTPLLVACGTNKGPELIVWLLANGADPRAQEEMGWNIYHLLCAYPDNDLSLIKHILTKLPNDVTETLMIQQSRGRQNTPLTIAVKAGNIHLVSLLLTTAKTAVKPTLIVSLLAVAGPPEALYMENGVGSSPYEMAASIALNNALRAQGFPNGCRTVFRSDQSKAKTLKGFPERIYSVLALEPEPEYTEEDGTEIKTFRRKPELLEALTAFAAESEKNWEASKANGSVVSNEEQSPPALTQDIPAGDIWKEDTSDPAKTFDVFSKAVVPVHQRTLVHLKDVREVVFSAVDDLERKDVMNEDRSKLFLSGRIWRQKDYY